MTPETQDGPIRRMADVRARDPQRPRHLRTLVVDDRAPVGSLHVHDVLRAQRFTIGRVPAVIPNPDETMVTTSR